MTIFIRFIGLIMIYQASSGAPYRAIIPKWDSLVVDKYCGRQIMEHAAYIRVANGKDSSGKDHIVDDSKWPKEKDCDPGQNCGLYRIETPSTLTVSAGFTPVAPLTPSVMSCKMPQLAKEGIVPNAKLHRDALTTLSIADMEIKSGSVDVLQFKNDSMFTAVAIDAPQGTPPQDIHIVATPRVGGGSPRELVVSWNTIVDVVNMPPGHAGADYEVQVVDPKFKGHFFFFHKLLDNPQDCRVPAVLPFTCPGFKRNMNTGATYGNTGNLGCGGSTCCG